MSQQLQKYTASYLFTGYLHTNEVFPTISLSCIDTSLNTQIQACTQMGPVSLPFLRKPKKRMPKPCEFYVFSENVPF